MLDIRGVAIEVEKVPVVRGGHRGWYEEPGPIEGTLREHALSRAARLQAVLRRISSDVECSCTRAAVDGGRDDLVGGVRICVAEAACRFEAAETILEARAPR